MDKITELNSLVKKHREMAGLSQVELAKRLLEAGVSSNRNSGDKLNTFRQYLSNIEREKSPVSYWLFLKILQVCGFKHELIIKRNNTNT